MRELLVLTRTFGFKEMRKIEFAIASCLFFWTLTSSGRSSLHCAKRGFAAVLSNKMPDKKFQEHGIVPDVIPSAPTHVLKIKYPSGVIPELGNELKPRQVKDQPEVKWEIEKHQFYTLSMTDPDAPSRKDPKNGEWLHWLVVNIPGDKIKDGQVLAEYVGSGPPQGTGLHRYTFLAFKQPGKITTNHQHLTNRSGEGRAKFHIKAFAEEHNLGNPVSGNFYQAQWDDYVPELYKQLSG